MQKFLFIGAALFLFSRCTDEEVLPAEPKALQDVSASSQSNDAPATSLTVSGIFTMAETKVDCKTCTYVVPANTPLIDGEKLALKPGSIICLDDAVKYGDLEFINLDGEAKSPIVIASTTRASNASKM